ncbi:MAG: MFS transporter [Gammaproteobacteria bacterium]
MRWLLLLGLWLTYLSFGAITVSLAPLVVPIQQDLGLSHAAMGSIMGAWQFVYIGAALPAGVLLDRLGARLALLLGVACIALSALGRAWAGDYWTLLGAVMLFGLGGPIISSGAPKVVTQIFRGSQRGLAMGIYMTGPTLGGIAALTLTHTVLLPFFDHDWRQLMILWAGLAVAAGSVWFAIATMAAGRVAGFSSGWDRHHGGPQHVSLSSLIRIPGLKLVLAMSVGVFLINHGLNNWLPELLHRGGMSVVQAGYWAALPLLVGIAGSLTIPRLATPERRYGILFGLCLAAAIATLLLTSTGQVAVTGALLMQGLVRSSLMTVLILTLMELPGIRTEQSGTASGLFFSAAEVGGVLGPLGLGLAYDLTGGFDTGLYALTIVSAAMMLGALRLRRLASGHHRVCPGAA